MRQDAWTHEDDLLLAETVLRHVREGSTQLNAFEEVGDKLNRTSAACGFRWNAEVRKHYVEAMELAKRQRKERQRALAKAKKNKKSSSPKYVVTKKGRSLTINDVIQFLRELEESYQDSDQTKRSIAELEKEKKDLEDQVVQLEKELKKTTNELKMIREDYQTFIEIMERARKMTVLEDQGTLKAPQFVMDKNGNLEQIAKRFNQM